MMAETPRGREVRQYFQLCEHQLKDRIEQDRRSVGSVAAFEFVERSRSLIWAVTDPARFSAAVFSSAAKRRVSKARIEGSFGSIRTFLGSERVRIEVLEDLIGSLSSVLPFIKLSDVFMIKLNALVVLFLIPFLVMDIDFAINQQVSNLATNPESEARATPLGKLDCNVGVSEQTSTWYEFTRNLTSEVTVKKRFCTVVAWVLFECVEQLLVDFNRTQLSTRLPNGLAMSFKLQYAPERRNSTEPSL